MTSLQRTIIDVLSLKGPTPELTSLLWSVKYIESQCSHIITDSTCPTCAILVKISQEMGVT